MQPTSPSYLIVAPVSRIWSLERYFAHLANLTYPADRLSFYFFLNNMEPGGEELVENFATKMSKQGSKVDVDTKNFPGVPVDSRLSSIRITKIYQHLADLRNHILQYFYTESKAEYMLSVDSDIYPDHNILNEFNKWPDLDYLSSWISNDIYRKNNEGFFSNCMKFTSNSTALKPKSAVTLNYIHIQNIPVTPQPFEVDLTGACFRISRALMKDPYPRFGWHKQGEDAVYCAAVQAKGFKLWCIKNNLAYHDIRQAEDFKT